MGFLVKPIVTEQLIASVINALEQEKLRRNHVLLEEQNVRGVALNRRVLGQAVEVLAEGPSARNPARWSGRTRMRRLCSMSSAR